MIIQRRVREIIREICEETGLSFNQVRDIVLASQYRFIVDRITSAEKGRPETFDNVMLRHLGSFDAIPNKIMKMHNQKNNKNEGE